jgi:hypothetical protein
MPGRRDIIRGYNYAVQTSIRRQEGLERLNEIREERGEKPVPIRPYTPTQYMLEHAKGPHKVVYRGETYYSSYRNADSARRAYAKLSAGETSGEKIYAKSEGYTYRTKEGGYELGKPKGMYEGGLWLAKVTYMYNDEDGDLQGPVTRSFVVIDKYDRFEAAYQTPMLESELDGAIENKMAEWAANKSDASDDYEVLYVTFEKIQRRNVTLSHTVRL